PDDKTGRPPAHYAVDCWNRPLLHDPGEKSLVRVVKLGRHTRGGNVDETIRPLLVESDHPVPQRLTIHSADLRRLFPRGSVEHRRDRQQPPRLRGILRPLSKPANLASRIVRPHRNGLAHGKRPSVSHLESLLPSFRNPRRVSHCEVWYYSLTRRGLSTRSGGWALPLTRRRPNPRTAPSACRRTASAATAGPPNSRSDWC